MEAVHDLEEQYQGHIVSCRGTRWRIRSVFATRNETGHPAECAASGRPIGLADGHLVVGAERLEYAYDYDHRTAFVVDDVETLTSWVEADAPEAPTVEDATVESPSA